MTSLLPSSQLRSGGPGTPVLLLAALVGFLSACERTRTEPVTVPPITVATSASIGSIAGPGAHDAHVFDTASEDAREHVFPKLRSVYRAVIAFRARHHRDPTVRSDLVAALGPDGAADDIRAFSDLILTPQDDGRLLIEFTLLRPDRKPARGSLMIAPDHR